MAGLEQEGMLVLMVNLGRAVWGGDSRAGQCSGQAAQCSMTPAGCAALRLHPSCSQGPRGSGWRLLQRATELGSPATGNELKVGDSPLQALLQLLLLRPLGLERGNSSRAWVPWSWKAMLARRIVVG